MDCIRSRSRSLQRTSRLGRGYTLKQRAPNEQNQNSASNCRKKRTQAGYPARDSANSRRPEWRQAGERKRHARARAGRWGQRDFAYKKYKPPCRAAAVPSRIRLRPVSVVDLTYQWPLSDVPAPESTPTASLFPHFSLFMLSAGFSQRLLVAKLLKSFF